MNIEQKFPRIDVAIPHIGQEEIDAVADVLRSGQYASGPKTAEFEDAFGGYVGTKHAAGVSNGTSALFIGLEALGIGPGDEVLVPALTFFSTVTSVIHRGATPVFVDIDEDDLCMSPSHAETVITDKTKCMIPVHLFGAAAKMDQLMALAKKHDIKILEDCAQSHGTMYGDKMTGSIGDAGAFSFFATKHMTTGEGGMITSDNAAAIEKSKILRSHGMSGRDDHLELGYNNRLNDISSAIGLVQLTRLDGLNEARIKASKYLMENLSDLNWAYFPQSLDPKSGHTYFWCALMIPEGAGRMEEFKDHMRAHNIGFRHRYNEPLYKQQALAKAGHDYSDIHLPTVERMAGRLIGLPNHPGLTKDELDRVISVVRSFQPK